MDFKSIISFFEINLEIDGLTI